ncbi:IS3 family transposase [Nonomuraea sp. B19D2]|uniref:IS3 family transposase n=1 Tax=Nonomuraea sp. B19D2 TaxID=3159561 RepID=UPI0032D9E88A
MVEFIESQRAEFGVPHKICFRALGVSPSWFYKWKNRRPTAREERRAHLDEEIKRHFAASGGTYGSPRITQDLRVEGWKLSENTVAKRMAELGLAGRRPKKPRSLTRQGKRPAAPDLVRRKFTAVSPDVLWVGDVTMIRTDEGPLYLSSVEELFSRRLLGYAMSEHHDAALTVASLQMAVVTRGGDVDGVTFHSDRGSEYTAARYQAECRKARGGAVDGPGRVRARQWGRRVAQQHTEGRVHIPAPLPHPR